MTASLSPSVDPATDNEAASSPAPTKSFHDYADEVEDTQIADQTIDDPSEKPSRKVKSSSKDKDANGQPTVGKIRHLKKEDGEPLWREDIQYDFLKAVFDNDMPVFTNSYDPENLGKQCFADLYIDTMSRSTKTSRVLRDKLLSDREAAKGMAMVCLLVNMGRMNTTLNCKSHPNFHTYLSITNTHPHSLP